MANSNLKDAKAAKNDEFYTQFHDIEVEMNATLNTTPMCSGGKPFYCPAMIPNGATLHVFSLPSSMNLD